MVFLLFLGQIVNKFELNEWKQKLEDESDSVIAQVQMSFFFFRRENPIVRKKEFNSV